MSILLTALLAILALAFVLAGGTKLAGMQMHVEHFEQWGYPQWFRIVTGLVEVMGAALLIVGIWVSVAAILGGLVLIAAMVGAIYTDIFRGKTPVKAIAPAVLLAIAVIAVVLGAGELS
jgi:uncharacterized membrane protein YphA (DoxX/SURF4 family)